MASELKLPDVGDNIEKGTVVAVLIDVGDSVTEGQPIIELETDKAVVEVPASASGTVQSINVQIGDSIPVGGVIATLGESATPAGEQAQGEQERAPAAPAATAPVASGSAAGGSVQATLPDVGDNIEKGTVVAVLVDVGDSVAEGQPIIELETDKAVVEVPANASGTVQSVNVQVGDSVKVGAPLLTLTSGAAPAASAPQAAPAPQPAPPQPAPAARTPAPATSPAAPPPAATSAPQTFDGRSIVHAAPSVRRLARELNVDIYAVQGTGVAGRISVEDVRAAASNTQAPAPSAPSSVPQPSVPHGVATAPASPLPDFNKWGQTTREDMSGIRKATVRSMTTSWTTIPMVTHFDKADVTVMEEVRKRFSERVEKAGGKLTMTHILMKVVAGALRKFPKFNASLDLPAEQIIFKDYVNIGVAVDTPVGLLVPVVKNADRKSITELVLELSELAGRARERKLKPDEMQGATFSISNLGGIGGHAFTPIVNSPEVAILGVSRGGIEPVWNKEKGEFEPRNMLPLSLTYDHRLIDGADAARFLRHVCESLEDPFLISL